MKKGLRLFMARMSTVWAETQTDLMKKGLRPVFSAVIFVYKEKHRQT